MKKSLKHIGEFDISDEAHFQELCGAFSHALKAVEAQGYGVEYAGEILYHPGQIGVIGPPASGKSTFFKTAMQAFAPEDSIVTEKYNPSHDQSRNILVWRHWISLQNNKEITLMDMHAYHALHHLAEMNPPDRKLAGLAIYEHVQGNEGHLDMLLKFRYNESGRRVLDVSATEGVTQNTDFKENFLPSVQHL